MEGSYFEGEVGKEATIGALKMFVSLFPGIGPFLAEAFFEVPSRLAQNRRDNYIDTVLSELQKVQESLIDRSYLESEDFVDLIQHILKKVVERKAKERANFFARLSAANMLTTRPATSIDWQFQLIDILANLNDSEMCLLGALEKHRSPSNSSVSGVSTPYGLEKAEFQICFDSLLSKGLVYDSGLSAIPKLGVGTNPLPREYINISPLGKKLIQSIKDVDIVLACASKK